MALIYEKKIFRNLQEQVEKNKQDIVDLQQTEMALNAYGIKVVGQVETALDIPEDFEGDYGDAYLVGDEAPYDVYVWTRPNSETPEDHFVDIGPIAIVGPMGPQGPQGETGATGVQGIGWITGTDQSSTTGLPDGTLNFNGLNGNIYKLVSGSWTLIGNIKGPQGVQGQQGPQGETGATGAQGPQGPKGDTGSSYQIIGTYAATANLPDPTLVNPGSAALVGADAPYELYIVVGATQDVQQWVDAGVFNDGGTSIPVIEVEVTNLNAVRNVTLNSDQINIISQNLTDAPNIIIIVHFTTYPTNYYIYHSRYAEINNGTVQRRDFICVQSGGAYSGNWVSSTPSNLQLGQFTELQTASNRVNFIEPYKTYTFYYPNTKAVYDYVNPINERTPKKTATMIIQGLIDPDAAVSIQVYAASDTNSSWLALANGFFNTNYTTISQMCSYLQTTLNALGAAPSTNRSTILQLIYVFVGMQMFSGNAIAIYTVNNNPSIYSRFLLNMINLTGNKISINSTDTSLANPANLGLDAWLDALVWGESPSLTDSDNLSFIITVH